MPLSAGAGWKDTLFKTNHDTSLDSDPEREWNIEDRYSIYSEFIFSLVGTTRTSKQGKSMPNVIFYAILEEESLCPYKTLEHYLEVT